MIGTLLPKPYKELPGDDRLLAPLTFEERKAIAVHVVKKAVRASKVSREMRRSMQRLFKSMGNTNDPLHLRPAATERAENRAEAAGLVGQSARLAGTGGDG